MSVRLLVVAALAWEARQILRHIEVVQPAEDAGATLWSGRHGDVDVWVLKTGMGQEQAARALRWAPRMPRPDAVLSTGCAGGLAAGLVPGEVVVAQDVVTSDGISRPTSSAWRERYAAASAAAGLRARQGTILSNTGIVSATRDKRRLAEASGAVAVEMEAAAIAGWASQAGVPFAAARVILDSAEMPVASDVAALTTSSGAVSPRRLLGALIRRPGIVRELFAVAMSARKCRRSLADLHRELLRGL